MTAIKTYSELIELPTFKERYRYLRLSGRVGKDTFGFDRYLNQNFYKSKEWERVRDQVIIRDNGCDLGIEDRQIAGKILIHHMNPITDKDILNLTDILLIYKNSDLSIYQSQMCLFQLVRSVEDIYSVL